jgi:hypothetical protein
MINLYSQSFPSGGILFGTRLLRRGRERRWIVNRALDRRHRRMSALMAKRAFLLSPAHDLLDGKLGAAWIAGPDGNPIQIVC